MLMSGGAGSKDQRSRAYRSDVLVLIGMYVRIVGLCCFFLSERSEPLCPKDMSSRAYRNIYTGPLFPAQFIC